MKHKKNVVFITYFLICCHYFPRVGPYILASHLSILISFLQSCAHEIYATDYSFITLERMRNSSLIANLTKRNIPEIMHLDHDVKVTLSNKCNSNSNECIVMKTYLTRRLTRKFVELILPPGLMVVTSWVRIENHKYSCRRFLLCFIIE